MSQIPNIGVQLVHIQGPLKGEIQTFASGRVLIGRHPDCDLQFPKDLVIISRRHAEIVREGNRFKLIDKSTNGTFVNGKPVSETFLKDGDVITFAEGGPKVSFLTQQVDQQPAGTDHQVKAPPAGPPPEPPSVRDAAQSPPQAPVAAPQEQQPPAMAPAGGLSEPEPEQVNVPFAIQFGPALKSFRSLPIIIGRGPGCDFAIDHPALEPKHLQVFFARDGYWIKDLTGQARVRVNSRPLQGSVALEPEAIISLAPEGPSFRFLGGGRLVEMEQEPPAAEGKPQAPSFGPPEQEPEKSGSQLPQDVGRKASSLFKKFFS